MTNTPAQDMSDEERRTLTQGLLRIALQAGAEIMRVYAKKIEVSTKKDASPVTEADERAEKIILAALADLVPHIPVVSEEAASAGHIPQIAEQFFLVDPLDGTKEFINRNGEFTVNIALIKNQVPVAGVVYAPALSRMFYASGPGEAYEIAISPDSDEATLEAAPPTPIKTRDASHDGLTIVGSRSHRGAETDEFLKDLNVKEFVAAGSSLKFCLVATGEADLYPRHGRTMEWDTAAGHAVLLGAGGQVIQFDGTAFLYGKTNEGFANPYFLAKGMA